MPLNLQLSILFIVSIIILKSTPYIVFLAMNNKGVWINFKQFKNYYDKYLRDVPSDIRYNWVTGVNSKFFYEGYNIEPTHALHASIIMFEGVVCPFYFKEELLKK